MAGRRGHPVRRNSFLRGARPRLGAPGAVRAVGTANGINRIAIVIPCHRVVRKNGETGGYGGGRWRKVALLDLEGAGVAPKTLA